MFEICKFDWEIANDKLVCAHHVTISLSRILDRNFYLRLLVKSECVAASLCYFQSRDVFGSCKCQLFIFSEELQEQRLSFKLDSL
jgi:hypothetical protein